MYVRPATRLVAIEGQKSLDRYTSGKGGRQWVSGEIERIVRVRPGLDQQAVPPAQRYTGFVDQEDADNTIVVTNTTFTDAAEDVAARTNLKLVDGDPAANYEADNPS